ncbi:MAG: O-antigen ligase family protein [Candidatus Accumulibacter sp.]|jgi:hypothetical protein|nr:O-antigen ligase family protein [Accumulibacter sp.]
MQAGAFQAPYDLGTCRIPDDWIYTKRHPLFMAREVMRAFCDGIQNAIGCRCLYRCLAGCSDGEPEKHGDPWYSGDSDRCGTALFFPEAITQRGLSYRIEIWRDAIEQILEKPWFGHGLSAPLQIRVEALNQTFTDPHNLTLSELYSGGLVGGILWIMLYLTALKEAWRWQKDQWVLVLSATVVYGFAAGLTQGGAFLSRPKEHWFLVSDMNTDGIFVMGDIQGEGRVGAKNLSPLLSIQHHLIGWAACQQLKCSSRPDAVRSGTARGAATNADGSQEDETPG